MLIKAKFIFAIILLSCFPIILYLPSLFLLKHGTPIEAVFNVTTDSGWPALGTDLPVEDLDWKLSYLNEMFQWVQCANGTTGPDGIISVEILPEINYRLENIDELNWYGFWSIYFNSTSMTFPHEIWLNPMVLNAIFKYATPYPDVEQPVASFVNISLYYFNGVRWIHVVTTPTNEEGFLYIGGLIHGLYSFNRSGFPSFEVVPPVTDVGVILLPPTCYLIYRKNRRKRRIILVRDYILAINIF